MGSSVQNEITIDDATQPPVQSDKQKQTRELKNLEIAPTSNFQPIEGKRTRTRVLVAEIADLPKRQADFSAAKQEELTQFIENDVFEEINKRLVPANVKILGSRWLLTEKRLDGHNVNKKARIVVQGCYQVKGVDDDESYSPVMSTSSLRTIIAIATTRRWKIHQMDVKTAYLNAPLTGEVYVRPPMDVRCEDKIWKIKKAMYGLPQAGRDWFNTFTSFLKHLDFIQCQADSCVFTKKNIIIGVYVDDLALAAENETILEEVKNKLKERFKMKDLGVISSILGIQVNQQDCGVTLNQSIYIEECIARFKLSEATPSELPLNTSKDLTNPHVPAGLLDEKAKQKYQQMVGCLMYLAVMTRPDITFSAALLSRFNAKPDQRHYTV